MRRLITIWILLMGLLGSLFWGDTVIAAEADGQETVTISVYETPRVKVTRTLTVEKGQSVNWWTPTLENTEFADDPCWVFAYWYRKDIQEIVTNQTTFEQDCSVYAVWNYRPTEDPPVTGELPGYEDEEEKGLTVQQIKTVKPVIKNLKNRKGRKLRFQTVSSIDVIGYDIRYAANRKFKKYKEEYRPADEKYITIGKLKKGKVYYVKIRGRAISGDRIYRTKWSTVKKIKIKR